MLNLPHNNNLQNYIVNFHKQVIATMENLRKISLLVECKDYIKN